LGKDLAKARENCRKGYWVAEEDIRSSNPPKALPLVAQTPGKLRALDCASKSVGQAGFAVKQAKPAWENAMTITRPDFDYSCECGYFQCNACEWPCYPMEVDADNPICPKCCIGDMLKVQE
jgi:hypothetical protein